MVERRTGADDGGREPESWTVAGHLPPGAPDFVYVPVRVPAGVRRIDVVCRYERPDVPPGTPGNALDLGLFDERGTGPEGFRGWSGGARDRFSVGAGEATPGYLAGPVNAGTWHVCLGPYTVAPDGLPYELTVTLTYGPPGPAPARVFPPERAAGRGRAWYRGDCHLHTVHSDGARTPAEVAAAARSAGLDFIVTTEHNTPAGHGAWAGLWSDDLLVLCGTEVTTRNGHLLALGTDPGTFTDWRRRARDRAHGEPDAALARHIRRAGGIAVPAHPFAACLGCSWRFGYAHADAVEVWNGPWTPDDEAALAAWSGMLHARPDGRRLPAMGNSDAHREPQAVGHPQTVVLADGLTRRAVLDALTAGRSYLAESAAVTLALTASAGGRDAGIGDDLTAPPTEPVTVRVDVAGVPHGDVRFVTDQGVVLRHALPASGSGTVTWRTTTAAAAHVRAEVRHPPSRPELPGPMAGMTNPVFLNEGPAR
ncbi:CehA/McbA family metallohydrolase [Streptomyces sp. RFCAC02]|uniref:CehA/McbA family metallohydrolase n=1 Tax=Streptomyces sp. RFCAC02 TaxID=2499143 RepID=UPI001F0F4F30|nr:CehA/McbA family metallohydrolase [Streptomyces sp. RFCAC02]